MTYYGKPPTEEELLQMYGDSPPLQESPWTVSFTRIEQPAYEDSDYEQDLT